MRNALPLLLVAALAAGCGDDAQVAEGIFAPLGEPMPSATPEQVGTFQRGLEVGTRRFAADDGFGPQFNVSFCLACHEKPVFGGSAGRYRNFLLVGQSLDDGSFVGTGVNGVQTHYTLGPDARVPTDATTNVIATRNPIPFFGVGLLAEIPDEEILSRADPDDADGDGISGRANFDRGFVGRFGRKSQSVAIESFIRGPLFNHMGITTDPLPPHRRAQLPVASSGAEGTAAPRAPAGFGSGVFPQVGAPDEPTEDDDGVPDPEMTEAELFDLVAMSMLTAAPQPDEPTDETEAGRALFDEAGCAGCHVPALKGPRGLIPAWTDLLIHDMGPDLADGIIMASATGSEFRTAPLWGIAAAAPYLHDGRADTLDEAIRWHGGEAAASRDAYAALTEADRGRVIAFLDSLGGRAQRTGGLLPPDAPIPPVGSFGGPAIELTAAEQEQFLRGRAIFDLDTPITRGLGPFFNGDACRACHFDPVIGGAGPVDVNVLRHAVIDDQGQFSAPAIGTMAHHHAVPGNLRAPVDPAANFFEHRQTPAIFGLGLIDQLPEATILTLADPNDLDGDQISGRAHVLSDGRVGRLGWKANVPSLAEFSRDAMANEMGVTLPNQDGLSFGFATDDDDTPDPEVSVADLEALTFYMASLAPPPRTRLYPALEDQGAGLFEDIGCAACHVPELRTAGDQPVRLYSDLLLHDVAPLWAWGIEDGDATMRELRTPPLWGLGATGPYMHDGLSFTIEDAILRHSGEARDSRDAYLELPMELQRALRAFLRSL